MSDCNSLESLLTSLSNEVAALKSRVAFLESKQGDYATKSELSAAIDSLRRVLESLIEQLRRNFESAIKGINDILQTLLGRTSNDLEGRVRNVEIRVNGLEGVTDSLRRTLQGLLGRIGKVESQVSDFLGRLSALENIQGQILRDIQNIYNILSRYKKDIDNLWAAIVVLQGQIAALAFLLLLKGKLDKLLDLLNKFNELAKLLNELRKLFDQFKNQQRKLPQRGRDGAKGDKGDKGDKGANGKDGKNGRDGRNGINGRDGRDGRNGFRGSNGINGRNGKDGNNGRNGRDGKNGKDGRDGRDGVNGKNLKMEYSNIGVKVFTGCNSSGDPVFSTQNVQCIRGTELLVFRAFEEIANLRGSSCKVCPSDDLEKEGEIFGLIEINEVERKISIPANAQKIIIEFEDIKPYISKRFSAIHPKYKDTIGTLSFLIDDALFPDIFLQYQKMVFDIPKAYTNNSKSAYIYLEDAKAKVRFWKEKDA